MHMQDCLRLADFARKDKSLIPNHIQSTGVDVHLRKHLQETEEFLELVKDDPAFVTRLNHDKRILLKALSVYTEEY